MKLAQTVLGEKLFTLVMKYTFYGHFVAGEDQVKIVPTLERYISVKILPLVLMDFVFVSFSASFSFLLFLISFHCLVRVNVRVTYDLLYSVNSNLCRGCKLYSS